jgi:hypothetical protein
VIKSEEQRTSSKQELHCTILNLVLLEKQKESMRMAGSWIPRNIFLRSPLKASSVAKAAPFAGQRTCNYNYPTNSDLQPSIFYNTWRCRTTSITTKRPFSYTHPPRDNYRRFRRNGNSWQFNYGFANMQRRFQRVIGILSSRVVLVIAGGGLAFYVFNLETVEVRLFPCTS